MPIQAVLALNKLQNDKEKYINYALKALLVIIIILTILLLALGYHFNNKDAYTAGWVFFSMLIVYGGYYKYSKYKKNQNMINKQNYPFDPNSPIYYENPMY